MIGKVKISDDYVTGNVSAGCMRIADMTAAELKEFTETCLSNSIDLFDHADIYGRGKCEEVFGAMLKSDKSLRDKMRIQTKCGIVPGKSYDFSYDHIIKSVEGSLKRLNTDYVDSLLLHRPDALVQPEEVAKAFEKLHTDGKVKYFGVSNHTPYQIELLKKYVKQPILINQLQFSIAFTGMVDAGMNTNMQNEKSVSHDYGILDYMRLNDMTVQAWSPYQKGFFGGVFIGDPEYKELNKVLDALSEKYNITPTGMATAFILRHPAKWQVVTGTTKTSRIKEIAAASKIKITHDEWYEIYLSAGNKLP